jgi:hypothetical protein
MERRELLLLSLLLMKEDLEDADVGTVNAAVLKSPWSARRVVIAGIFIIIMMLSHPENGTIGNTRADGRAANDVSNSAGRCILMVVGRVFVMNLYRFFC